MHIFLITSIFNFYIIIICFFIILLDTKVYTTQIIRFNANLPRKTRSEIFGLHMSAE
ncbi:hypothetical protein BvCms454_00734 [Escherichia coli]|nr:hypothetical protein BvCms454_00734 [Escherichia coli]